MYLDARRYAASRRIGIMTIATMAAAIAVSPTAVRAQAVPIETTAKTQATNTAAVYSVKSGSYVVSRNIVVSGGRTNAINITGPNVTINFQGYSIIGKNSAAGMGVDASGQTGLTIENGNITGMGGGGVVVGAGSTVSSMHITNGGPGIVGASSCLIENNVVTGNTSNGINAAGVIRSNVSDGNGISISIAGNGITTVGITTTGGMNAYSSITGNEVSGNTGYGIAMQSNDGFSNNVINNNTGGSVTGGVNAGGNVCGSTTCP